MKTESYDNNTVVLKPSVFPSIAIYLLLRLMSRNLTIRCLAVTGGGSVGECDGLSQPIWHLGAL